MAATTDVPTLIVNADDFGMSEGINRGIMDAFAGGALRSTTIMVGMPAFEDAVRRAGAAGESLGVGLHFTLTAGRPLTPARTLVDPRTGVFVDAATLVMRTLRGRIRIREVEDECAAQIARARDAGLSLTHVDSHHHVHLLPNVRDAVRRVVEAERIPAVRRPLEALVGIPQWKRRLATRALIRLLMSATKIEQWRLRTTDHFLGHTLVGGKHFQTSLIHVLESLPGGTTELMVHPGYVRESLPGGDPYTTQREMELSALLSPAVLERLHGGGLRLANFAAL